MSTTATRTPARTTTGDRTAWVVVAAVLVAVGVAYGRARWPGFLPLGSDNDEYQLVGRALAAFEPPLVAGVEGTKYPLGYPALLALFEWLRLPVAPTALAFNLVALAATVGLVAHLAGRATPHAPANPGAALAAGGVVVTSVSVWNDAYSVMPELALLLVVAALLTGMQAPLTGRRLVVVTALAIVAVLLKTLAILLVAGGCGVLWLVNRLRARDTMAGTAGGTELLPAAAALGAVLVGMLTARSLPEHTTGYLATFPLHDPFDASQGTLGVRGLVARTLADVPATVTDLGRAIALIDAGTAVAIVVAVVGLGLGVVAAFRLRPGAPLGPFAAGATLAYAFGMASWPYHSSRFGIPLVPVAALGAGWLVRVLTDRVASHASDLPEVGDDARLDATVGSPASPGHAHRWGSLAVGAGIVGLLVATSWSAVVDRGDAARTRLAAQHAAMDELERFADRELDGVRLVSFDYREVSHRLDRPVAPLAYTWDTDALLDQVGDAEVVVMVDIHRTRNRQLAALLEAEPDRFTPMLEGEGVGAYRVGP